MLVYLVTNAGCGARSGVARDVYRAECRGVAVVVGGRVWRKCAVGSCVMDVGIILCMGGCKQDRGGTGANHGNGRGRF